MDDYTKYVMAVNKIFECVEKMKSAWTNQDNLNYLKKIEDYKALVIEQSKVIQQESNVNVQKKETTVEELG